jgi:hypothetical protein
MKLTDLRDCINSALPHRVHDIDFEEAKRRLVHTKAYDSAWEAWCRYDSLLSTVRLKMNSWPRAEGLADLAEDLRVIHRIESPEEHTKADGIRGECKLMARNTELMSQNAVSHLYMVPTRMFWQVTDATGLAS